MFGTLSCYPGWFLCDSNLFANANAALIFYSFRNMMMLFNAAIILYYFRHSPKLTRTVFFLCCVYFYAGFFIVIWKRHRVRLVSCTFFWSHQHVVYVFHFIVRCIQSVSGIQKQIPELFPKFDPWPADPAIQPQLLLWHARRPTRENLGFPAPVGDRRVRKASGRGNVWGQKRRA